MTAKDNWSYRYVKFTPEQAMKVQMGSRSISILFL